MKSMINMLGMGLVALLAACSDIEPLGMEVQSVPKDLDAIKAFKSTEHPKSLVWFSNWKADGNMNTYLNTLPDSIDMVVLESGYETLSVSQKEDLSAVQTLKGTKVLVSVDIDQWVSELQSKLEMAESDAEAEVEEQAKDENREVTPEELDIAIKAAQEKVKTAQKIRLNEIQERVTKVVAETGYDGVSLHISAVTELFVKECVYGVIDQFGAKFGTKATGRLLVLEGDLFYLTPKFGLFHYLVHTGENLEKWARLQEQYDRLKRISGFESKRFMVYLSLEDKSWDEPFPDMISAQSLTEPRYMTLALWTPNDGAAIGGMALRAVEKDYERKYSVLRNILQYLNLK